jgi:hypothetical protein
VVEVIDGMPDQIDIAYSKTQPNCLNVHLSPVPLLRGSIHIY